MLSRPPRWLLHVLWVFSQHNGFRTAGHTWQLTALRESVSRGSDGDCKASSDSHESLVTPLQLRLLVRQVSRASPDARGRTPTNRYLSSEEQGQIVVVVSHSH